MSLNSSSAFGSPRLAGWLDATIKADVLCGWVWVWGSRSRYTSRNNVLRNFPGMWEQNAERTTDYIMTAGEGGAVDAQWRTDSDM